MSKEDLLKILKSYSFQEEIIGAFNAVKRENFVPKEYKEFVYENRPLPIGLNQTISQPYTIAVMLSELNLKKGHRVLEVGSGSGYVLALISEIVGVNGEVFGVERINDLAVKSKNSLKSYKNVEVFCRNGAKGLKEKALFDRIIISAAIEKFPDELLNQLVDNGLMVAPLGSGEQSIVCIKRIKNKFVTLREIPGFVFVPFIS